MAADHRPSDTAAPSLQSGGGHPGLCRLLVAVFLAAEEEPLALYGAPAAEVMLLEGYAACVTARRHL